MKNRIENKTFDEERALYNLIDTEVVNVTFAGPQDGESVLKETRGCDVIKCNFSLRYAYWHAKDFSLIDSSMDDLTRAPLWYCDRGLIKGSKIHSIKALRQCNDIKVEDCDIESPEFGWKSNNIEVKNTTLTGDYPFFDANNISFSNFKMKGKYSLQYIENIKIENSYLDTKDCFWHSKNIIVKNSVVKGEYLAWFSDNLTFINCKIIGTQPLCYCTNLTLINCTMEDTDLSFEYSDVNANIVGHVVSIKNPRSGIITCDSVGEIIRDHTIMDCNGEIIVRNEKEKKD